MRKNNYPQAAVDEIEPEGVQQLCNSIRELYDKGKPQSDEEVKQRIDEYFDFCQRSSIRPGIETLALSLHVSRITIYNWGNGVYCSPERQEIIQRAKGFIAAFLEQAILCGKISPPSGIFIAKNWLGYRDSISIEESIPKTSTQKALTAEELPQLGEWQGNSELPTL